MLKSCMTIYETIHFDINFSGHCEVVRLLLDYGSDIEHRNKAGCTPLMLAARYEHFLQ